VANDTLAVAQIELDAAWEAHKQATDMLDVKLAELATVKRMRRQEGPVLNGFERISGIAWRCQMRGLEAKDAIDQILEVISETRQKREDIAAVQRKAKMA
jgi:hypothetical protein